MKKYFKYTRKVIPSLLIVFGIVSIVLSSSSIADESRRDGAVYAMTNKADGNEVIVYDRAIDGTLNYSNTYPTGGLGTGGDEPFEPVDALGSQSPMILSQGNSFLFAVNAISDTISVFRVNRLDNSLSLTDIVSSGGEFPVSLTMNDDLLYVLNSAGAASISGFLFDDDTGQLKAINDSTRSLNFVGDDTLPRFLVAPAQISFNEYGEVLVVTVKGSDSIHVFSMNKNGQPSANPVTTESNGSTPFGFGFDRNGHLLVAEAFGIGDVGQEEASAVTSYQINRSNTLTVISASVANRQTASCWLISNNRIPFAYTTNNASHTISGYKVEGNGGLSLLNASGIVASTGNNPVDLALTKHGQYLYAVNAGDGTISMFRVNTSNGDLVSLGVVDGLPEKGAVGIAAR